MVRNEISHPNKSIRLGLINIQSIKNKAFLIHDCIIDNKVELTVLTETWLVNNDRDSIWIQSTNLNKHHLSMVVHNRDNRSDGGLALIYKNTVLDAKVSSKGVCRTFEFAKWKVTSKGITTTLIGIYHPHYSTISAITNAMSLDDLTEWLSEQCGRTKT